MPGLPNIRGGNDPNRVALLNALSRGRPGAPAGAPATRSAQPMQRPMAGAPQGQPAASPLPGQQGPGSPPVSFGDKLADALQSFQGTPEDVNALQDFFEVFKQVAEPFSQGSQGSQAPQAQPTMGFAAAPAQAAQSAPTGRGVRGY